MRIGLALAFALVAAGCLDVHELQGEWSGKRIGDAPVLRVGFDTAATAELDLDAVEQDGLSGRLTITGVIDDAPIAPILGAQSDVLAGLTHTGNPVSVHMAFVNTVDGGGPATVLVSVYDKARIEVRVLRGGATPLYGVFRLGPR